MKGQDCKFHSPAWLQLTVLSPASNVHANVLTYTHIHKTLPLCRNLCSWRLGHPGEDKIAKRATIPSFQKNDNICKTTPKWPWTSPCRLLGSFIWKWCYKKMFCLIECQINWILVDFTFSKEVSSYLRRLGPNSNVLIKFVMTPSQLKPGTSQGRVSALSCLSVPSAQR